jgi:hypothetical protein
MVAVSSRMKFSFRLRISTGQGSSGRAAAHKVDSIFQVEGRVIAAYDMLDGAFTAIPPFTYRRLTSGIAAYSLGPYQLQPETINLGVFILIEATSYSNRQLAKDALVIDGPVLPGVLDRQLGEIESCV